MWALSFTNNINFSPYGGGYFWHVHEMLFGFTVAIIAGFLLTAVQTWAGVPSIKGIPLAILVTVWLLARVLFLLPSLASPVLIVAVYLLFLPLAAIALSIPIIKAKLWRNLFFVPILLIMATLNLLSHLAMQGKVAVSFISIGHIMVLLVSLVMCVMGGRVFPMFTANGTRTPKVMPIAWLEKVSIVSVVLSILVTTNIVDVPSLLAAIIYLIAGIANLIRALRWKIWVAFSTPLVWSLHLSYWAIGIGFILLKLSLKFELLNNLSLAYHAITVGGIGFMILSMISRVSLGHTGRIIQVGKPMTLALIAIGLSFVVRVFMPLVSSQYHWAILISAGLWVLAYGLFVINYCTVLFKARIS